MMTKHPWILWFFSVHMAAGLFTLKSSSMQKPCNGSLPSTMSPWMHQDLSGSVPRTLTRCPEQFHGCSQELISCSLGTYVVTCSCELNCRAYGDCCWNVTFPTTPVAQMPRAACIEVQVSPTAKIHVNMVTGCAGTWPNDDVRDACERPESFTDIFYIIPATSATGVTYRNGFCAKCNNDIANTTFWSVVEHRQDRGVHILPPRVAQSHASLHLRPCNQDVTIHTCWENISEVVSLKCKMYYAPVRDASIPGSPAFKNVYCALCNGVNMSRLSCSPTVYLPMALPQGVHTSQLNSSVNRVMRTPACYAHHDGRCYIRRIRDVSKRHHSSRVQDDIADGKENSTKLDFPSRYRSEGPSKYGLQHYIAFICISLSIYFLILKLIVFCVYKEARSSSSACRTCMAVTLLVAQVLFLVTKCVKLEECVCFAGAVFAHYSFLSTFLWTGVLSYDIWKSLTTIKVSSTSRNKLALYSLFSWGVPLLVVSVALTVDQTAPQSVLSPRYGDPICFIGSFWGLVVYFLLPMASLVLFCLVLYFYTVCYIRSTSAAAERVGDDSKPRRGDNSQQRTNLALFVRLAIIMGAPWAVALAGFFVHSVIIESIVNALVGSQGVYLFFVFKDYRHIWLSFRKRIAKTAPRTSSSMFV
ncbi:hypothetical protein HPB49_025136 [Dermacentor silvarum]|uniref:Uncharacterized protein n=2 Tax=Dermacentor silvarum TaxID=543639 RepID=A0ACB8DRB2_DERSI|nr:uncharacterized protein LOC119430947 isoform X2 [Dermacentor silvarum]KAH7975217.1 hypothetical protein HPB49_025136 [Dermacentor silvarum]